MKREAVEEIVSSVVEGIIAGTDMELVDVDYVRERDWYLRVYIDKPGGVDLDDCQLVSEKLSAPRRKGSNYGKLFIGGIFSRS